MHFISLLEEQLSKIASILASNTSYQSDFLRHLRYNHRFYDLVIYTK